MYRPYSVCTTLKKTIMKRGIYTAMLSGRSRYSIQIQSISPNVFGEMKIVG
jgi:hypothetical protein